MDDKRKPIVFSFVGNSISCLQDSKAGWYTTGTDI